MWFLLHTPGPSELWLATKYKSDRILHRTGNRGGECLVCRSGDATQGDLEKGGWRVAADDDIGMFLGVTGGACSQGVEGVEIARP